MNALSKVLYWLLLKMFKLSNKVKHWGTEFIYYCKLRKQGSDRFRAIFIMAARREDVGKWQRKQKKKLSRIKDRLAKIEHVFVCDEPTTV